MRLEQRAGLVPKWLCGGKVSFPFLCDSSLLRQYCSVLGLGAFGKLLACLPACLWHNRRAL